MVSDFTRVYDLTLTRHNFVISPGRAFAIWEIKALFAYMVTTYDLKFEEGKSSPSTIFMGELRAPGDTNILFRERKK